MATYYWVGGNGTWDNVSTANWSASSGGAAGAGPPTSADNVNFDVNSGTAATVNVATTAACNDCVINKADISISLSDNVTLSGASSGTFYLVQGTLALNNYTLTVWILYSFYTSTRTIDFGTGTINVTSNNTTSVEMRTLTGFSYSGTPNINCTYSGAVGTRIVRMGSSGGATETNIPNLAISAGSDATTIIGYYKNLDYTGYTGATAIGASYNIYGNLTLGAGMTVPANTNGVYFASSSATQEVTTNGVTIDAPVFKIGAGTVALQTDFLIGSSRALTLSSGTWDANGKNVGIGTFALGAGTKTLTLGSGTWTVAGSGTAWDANTNVANLTVSASAGVINMTSASAKTFRGGAKAWPTLNQGGAGALTIQQSNTFANITNTVQPATITLTSGTTQTVTSFTASGTSGNLITLNSSTAGSRATLTDSGGVNSVSFVDIKDIAATGYGEWQAYTSNGNVDSGNNVGWVFAEPPPLTASEYQISLKSFTERRSF